MADSLKYIDCDLGLRRRYVQEKQLVVDANRKYHERARKLMLVLKEQCDGIFRLRFFFIKQLLLVRIGMPRNDFEFSRIFVELFLFVIDSSAMSTPGS